MYINSSFFYSSIRLFVLLSICLFVYLSILLFVYSSIVYLSICFFVYLSILLSLFIYSIHHLKILSCIFVFLSRHDTLIKSRVSSLKSHSLCPNKVTFSQWRLQPRVCKELPGLNIQKSNTRLSLSNEELENH